MNFASGGGRASPTKDQSYDVLLFSPAKTVIFKNQGGGFLETKNKNPPLDFLDFENPGVVS